VTSRQILPPLELAAETAFGEDLAAPPLPDVDRALDPLRALEDSVVPYLERPPCIVSFSGGRDSSAILAVAVRAARREGLPPPVPVTLLYPGEPAADESAWQELVVRHLGLTEWERVELRSGERDLLGPLAQHVLRRHGVISPFGTYSMIPVFQRGAGGTVLTGEDGDGLFEFWEYQRPIGVLSGQLRPELRDLRRLAKVALPASLRRPYFRRFRVAPMNWLRPAALGAYQRLWSRELASEPRRWDRRVDWWSRRRVNAVIKEGFGMVAGGYGAEVVHPFFDPRFLAALARRGGRRGFGDRTRAMSAVFSEVLPEAILRRKDKADFTRSGWGPAAKRFIAAWSGMGVPLDLVDPAGLRAAWAEALPDARTILLLHAAWLAESAGDDVEQPIGRSEQGLPA
jgi:asparagine synthetase B (glutamine-hydrolysing)